MPNGATWGYLDIEIPPAAVGTSDVKFQGKKWKKFKSYKLLQIMIHVTLLVHVVLL